jgi:hypothetical protein
VRSLPAVASSDGLGDEPGRSREEEGRRCSAKRLQSRQLPDLGVPGQQESRRGALRDRTDHIRSDHQCVPGKPVGPDSADEHEDDLGETPAGDDEADVGRRSGQFENGERERHDRKGRARVRRDSPQEHQSKLALGERGECVPHAPAGLWGTHSASRRLSQ